MWLRLKQAARINHEAGETVEVSPAQAAFLLSVGAAEIAEARQKETPEKTKAAKRKG